MKTHLTEYECRSWVCRRIAVVFCGCGQKSQSQGILTTGMQEPKSLPSPPAQPTYVPGYWWPCEPSPWRTSSLLFYHHHLLGPDGRYVLLAFHDTSEFCWLMWGERGKCSVAEAAWENRSVSHIICQSPLLTAERVLIMHPQSCPSFGMTLALVVCPPHKLSAAEVFFLHSGTGWFIDHQEGSLRMGPAKPPSEFRGNMFHS